MSTVAFPGTKNLLAAESSTGRACPISAWQNLVVDFCASPVEFHGGTIFAPVVVKGFARKRAMHLVGWSFPLEGTPTQQCLAAINSLLEPHTMTRQEAAYFRREMASAFVPLTPEQTRILPKRKK